MLGTDNLDDDSRLQPPGAAPRQARPDGTTRLRRSVIVVGAGIAGLAAAHYLARAGMDVLVLEGAQHVGGRMATDRRDGYLVDRGAQFLSEGYSVLGELIAACGLAPRLRPIRGWSAVVRRGRPRAIAARRPWTLATSGLLTWRATARLGRATFTLLRRTRTLPLGDYSAWHRWDDADAAAWIQATFGRGALDFVFEPMLAGLYFQEPEGMSRAWPAIAWSFGVRGGRLTALAEGMGSLPEALARGLDIRVGTPALAIDTTGPGVRVRTGSELHEAERAVLATTATVARRLYTVERAVEHRLLETRYSASINVSLIVPDGLAAGPTRRALYGLLIPRSERQAIAAVACESSKGGSYAPRGELLNVLLCGAAAERLMAADDARILDEVLPELARYLPGVASRVASAQLSRWPEAEPCCPVGRCSDVREYRLTWRPHMKVALAGDYMGIPCTEGAAESGRWAAAALADAAPRGGAPDAAQA